MQSRRSLVVICLSVFTAGCLQDQPPDRTEDRDDSPGDDADRDDSEGDDPEPGGSTAPYSVSVSRVAASSVYEAAGVALVEDYPTAVRAAIGDATSGGYETDEPPAELASLVARYDRVAYVGETYELDASFPIYRLVLERVAYEDVAEDDVVGSDRFRESQDATHAIQEAAEDGAYETASVPELLHELVAEYDYVTMTDVEDGPDADYFAWEIERDDDGPPYELVATTVDDVELPATEYGDLPDEAQAEFDAGRDGRHDLDEQPALQDALDGERFVRYDGEYYRVSIGVA